MLCLGLVILACAWVAKRLPQDVTNDWKRSLVDVMETSLISQPHHRDDQIPKQLGRIRSGHEDMAANKPMLDATLSPKVAPTNVRRKRVTPHQAKSCAAEYKWRCAKCGKMLGADFQIDHIVPLHMGGEHSLSNMQPLHPQCHAKKNSEEQMAARR